MNDIEKSEVVIARILDLLAEWGIQDAQLEFHELNLDDEFNNFFCSCAEWLVCEGIIRVREVIRLDDGGCVYGPTLTSYGFSLLNQKIQLNGGEVAIHEEVKRVSSAGKDYAPVGDFVGGLLGGFTKSMGS